jgi:hypothetical protein
VRVLSNHRFASCLLASLLFVGCAENIHKTTATEIQQISPLAATELNLKEFFNFPVGSLGLEPTSKLLSLKGKTVQISGYMVKEEEPTAGLFMLAPLPVNMAEKEDGPADDMPPATLFVHVPPADKNTIVPYHKDLWQLTGTLELGNQEEANGRMSYARLILN